MSCRLQGPPAEEEVKPPGREGCSSALLKRNPREKRRCLSGPLWGKLGAETVSICVQAEGGGPTTDSRSLRGHPSCPSCHEAQRCFPTVVCVCVQSS